MLTRSAITLVQLQVGISSEKFKSYIRQQLISDQTVSCIAQKNQNKYNNLINTILKWKKYS